MNWASSLARDELGIVTIGIVTYVSQHHQRRRRHLHAASCECEFLRECFGHFAPLELSSVGEFSCFRDRPLLERDLFWGHQLTGATRWMPRPHLLTGVTRSTRGLAVWRVARSLPPPERTRWMLPTSTPLWRGQHCTAPCRLVPALPPCAVCHLAELCAACLHWQSQHVPCAMCCVPPLAEPVCAVCHVLCASITVGLAAI